MEPKDQTDSLSEAMPAIEAKCLRLGLRLPMEGIVQGTSGIITAMRWPADTASGGDSASQARPLGPLIGVTITITDGRGKQALVKFDHEGKPAVGLLP